MTHPNCYQELLRDQFEIAKNGLSASQKKQAEDQSKLVDDSPLNYSPVLRRRSTRPKVNLLDLTSLTIPLRHSRTERGWFDFSKDSVLCLEEVIRSCYSNPDRQKFPNIRQYCCLFTDNNSPEYFFNRIGCEMPSAMRKFNDAEIHLYDVSTFYKNGAVRAKFLEQIKMCRWFGPY